MANHVEGYHALCRLWASLGFVALSDKQSQSQGHEAKHTYGGDGHFRKAKQMVRHFKLN